MSFITYNSKLNENVELFKYKNIKLRLGDLVFQDLPEIYIIDLIYYSQNSKGPVHVGIVSGFDSLGIPIITEAFPILGVHTISLPLFVTRYPFGIFYKTWKDQTIVEPLLANIATKIGLEYNIHFSDNPSSQYCSGLICEAYNAISPIPILCTQTMLELSNKVPGLSSLYVQYEGIVPNFGENIWTPKDLLDAKELEDVI